MKCVWPRIRFPPSGISSGTIFSSINAILLRCAGGRDGRGGQDGWRVFPGVVERAEEAEGAEKLFFLNSLRLCVSAVEDLGARRLRAEAYIIEVVPPLTFAQARETVVATVRAARVAIGTEEADLE